MTSEWLAAGAAVAAAIIGPIATIVAVNRQNRNAATIARGQIKATIVSASRQAWIDKLRNAIADFQAAIYEVHYHQNSSFNVIRERDSNMHDAIRLRSQIVLLVNPKEPDHTAFVGLIDKALSVALTGGEAGQRELVGIQAAMTEKAQSILKHEWERVKAGEPDDMSSANALTLVPRA